MKITDIPQAIVEHEQEAEMQKDQQPEEDTFVAGELLQTQIASLFDLKPSESSQYSDKLEVLTEYAKLKTKDRSPEALKWAIRSLSLKLGTPPVGEKLINYLSQYAYLELESMKIEDQKNKYIQSA